MPSVTEILDTMAYGPAPETAQEARSWLAGHTPFGPFIGGAFRAPGKRFGSLDPATGATLAEVTRASAEDVLAAVAAARDAAPGWAALCGHDRAQALRGLAAAAQKRTSLLAQIEALDTGKPLREIRTQDLPGVIAHFRHHAGRAELLAEDFPTHGPLGVIGVILPWAAPLPELAAHLAPALAAGNAVVLLPSARTPLSALAFAELCASAGLPAGVVNVLTGDDETATALAAAAVDGIHFVGATATGRALRTATAGSGKALQLAPDGKAPFLVFADADLDAAVEGVAEAVWSAAGQARFAPARLLVAEAVTERFTQKLIARMGRLRVGDPLDANTDLGPVIDPEHLERIRALVARGVAAGGRLIEAGTALPAHGSFCAPGLLLDTQTTNPCYEEDILGPVATLTTFRTPQEALELANGGRPGPCAAIWSENGALTQDIAARLHAGIVWINATGLASPAAPRGGRAGLAACLRGPAPAALTEPAAGPAGSGGDVTKAVSSALKAQSWTTRSACARASVLQDLAARLEAHLASSDADPAEVAAVIGLAHRTAAQAERAQGTVIAAGAKMRCLATDEPLGVIGIACPQAQPLLGLMALVLPAIAMGNRVVAIPAATAPLAELAALFHGAGLPTGVVSLIAGPRDALARALARHEEVAALWYAGAPESTAMLERESAGDLKTTWCPTGRDWARQPLAETLSQAVRVKTIWSPYGA